MCRAMGRAIDRCGVAMEGKYAVVEAGTFPPFHSPPSSSLACPSVQNLTYGSLKPTLNDPAFVAPSAAISGDVTLSKGSSVWYNSVVRGMALQDSPTL